MLESSLLQCVAVYPVASNGQINGFARATEISISFVIWFSWKFRSWMVLFGSLLNRFVRSFARAYVLSKLEFDADWCIDFSVKILIIRFIGLETFFLYLFYKNSRSRFMLETWSWWWYLCQFRILKLFARTRLLRWFYSGSDDTALLPLFLLKIRSVRMLDETYVGGHWFGCSLLPGTQLYSPWTLDWSALSWSLTKEEQR